MPTRHTTRPATGPILGLVAVNTGLAALLLAAAASRVAAPGALSMPWWLLAACFMVTEILVIHVQFRRGAHTFSLSEIPLVLGLFFAPPALILLARLLGAGLALVAHRRQALVKLLFNLSMFAVEVALASAVFHAVARHDDVVSPRAWAAAFCATLAATVYTTLAVSLAISISEGRLQPGVVGRVLATGVVLSALANTSLALVAVVALSANIAAGWLLAVVATIVFLAYSGYNSLRQRYHSLELLYDFTRVATGSVRVEALATAILSQARALLKAEQAEIVLADLGAGRDDGTLRMTLRDDDDRLHLTESVRLDPAGIRARVLGSGRPLLVPRHTSDEALATQLGREGLRDAMAAPLRGDGRIVGVMLVGSRLGDVRGFDREDLKLFETLANHTGVAIENGRLVQQLRAEVADKEHQALHDALTGLPNRTLFHERLRAALTAACAASTGVAVMLIDLDRFKEVNDTLGHHYGDRLLQAISGRLAANLRASDMVARLGGDEFALLLTSVADPAEAGQVARRVLDALEQPFVIDEMILDIDASIGIAVHPENGDEPDILLQRADVAMYAAKANRNGFELYAAEADPYSPRRLALVSELREAVQHRQLNLHYQPKCEIATGRVTGAEALLRWPHPRHGQVPPDEFIPIAEQTGAIRPLTLFVVGESLAQCRLWREQGLDLDVAVNLSARSLVDAELPDQVDGLLAASGLPPSILTLEITESSLMADSGRALGVLSRLRDLGVRLSIDDFGTGYSSLSYLKRLPVSEVKIDRSFVVGLADDDNDMVIVRSIVDLGHNLGLTVVAEGVEDSGSWARLRELGCDLAQGYLISPPQPPAQLGAVLAGPVTVEGSHGASRPLATSPRRR